MFAGNYRADAPESEYAGASTASPDSSGAEYKCAVQIFEVQKVAAKLDLGENHTTAADRVLIDRLNRIGFKSEREVTDSSESGKSTTMLFVWPDPRSSENVTVSCGTVLSETGKLKDTSWYDQTQQLELNLHTG